jgi:PIN domain nuclease of toxin-antitoxin system
MRALLDTHTLLWWVTNDSQLSQPVREIITNPENTIYFSVASSWEIIIKYNAGKLPLPEQAPQFIESSLKINRFESLSIELSHILQIHQLPDYHRDPFDRILVAQAQVENLLLLTIDHQIKRYPIQTFW